MSRSRQRVCFRKFEAQQLLLIESEAMNTLSLTPSCLVNDLYMMIQYG